MTFAQQQLIEDFLGPPSDEPISPSKTPYQPSTPGSQSDLIQEFLGPRPKEVEEGQDIQKTIKTSEFENDIVVRVPDYQMVPYDGTAMGGNTVPTMVDRKATIKKYVSRVPGMEIDTDTPAVSFWERYDISRTQNHQDWVKKWEKKHPKGRLGKINVPEVGPVVVVKHDISEPNEPWSLVNPIGVDSGDVAEFLTEAPAIAAELALITHPASRQMMLSRGFFSNAAATFMATAGIRLADDYLIEDKLRGFNPDYQGSAMESVFDALLVGGIGKVEGSNLPGMPWDKTPAGAMNDGQGFKIPTEIPYGMERQYVGPAMREMGIRLPPDAYWDNRIAQRSIAQFNQTTGFKQRNEREVMEIFGRTLRDISNIEEGSKTPQKILGDIAKKNAVELYEGRLVAQRDEVKNLLPSGRELDIPEAAKSQIDSMNKWNENTGIVQGKKYDEAFEEVSLSMNVPLGQDTLDLMDEIIRGIPIMVNKEVGEEGETELVEEGIKEITGDLHEAIVKFRNNPDDQIYEGIKKIRTRLYEYGETTIFEKEDNSQRQARHLFERLGTDIEKILSPKALNLKKNADDYYKKRLALKSNKKIHKFMNSDEPSKFVQDFMANPQPETMAALRTMSAEVNPETGRVAESKSFKELRTAYFTHLMRNPQDIESWIYNFEKANGQKGGKFWIDDKQMGAIKALGDRHQVLQGHPYKKMQNNAADSAHFVEMMLDEKLQGTDFMREIIEDWGGKGSAGHKLLKAGMADMLFSKAFGINDEAFGSFMLDPKKFRKVMSEWSVGSKRDALAELFEPWEMAKLHNIDMLNSYFLKGADMGAGLEGAQIVAKLKGVAFHPMAAFDAIHELTVNKTLGWLVMSPAMDAFLLSGIKKPITNLSLWKAVAVASNGLVQTVNDQYDYINKLQEDDIARQAALSGNARPDEMFGEDPYAKPKRGMTYQQATGDYSPIQ